MKTLVAYFSQSGNTEKIARAFFEEAKKAGDADLLTIDEVNPNTVADYDLICIGSPIHEYTIPAEVTGFLKKVPRQENTRFAGFVTHSAPAYPEQALGNMIKPLVDACNETGMEYKGCFSCQGYLAEALHKPVQQMMNLDDAAWAKSVEQMRGHPDEDDVIEARAFAQSLFKGQSAVLN
jgi:flavodoxin